MCEVYHFLVFVFTQHRPNMLPQYGLALNNIEILAQIVTKPQNKNTTQAHIHTSIQTTYTLTFCTANDLAHIAFVRNT